MKKINISQFLSETPSKQQIYLEEIIEQEQHLSELPEKYFPKDKSNLVAVLFGRCNELSKKQKGRDMCGVFLSYKSGEYATFLNGMTYDCFISTFFNGGIDNSMNGNVYWCRYTIDYNMCSKRTNDKCNGVPMKLEILDKIADNEDEYYYLFEEKEKEIETISNYESQIEELNEQNEKLKEKNESVQKLLDKYKNQVKKLNMEVEKSASEKSTLETKITESEKEKSALKTKITESEREKSALKNKITESEMEKSVLEIKITESEREKSALKNKITESEREKSALEAELKNIRYVSEIFSINIHKKDTAENIRSNIQNPAYYPEMVNNVYNYLGSNKLYYDYDVIGSFASGLLTNQIIILSGDSGTGKSTLPVVFAEAIGACHKIISVQPSWTDNQDLLGFFDFSKGCFSPTPFMDALVEADRNPDKIYIICLDEMNLVRVEYYFSEILSAMESKDKTLHLYSRYIFDENIDELKYKIPRLSDFDNDSLIEILKNNDVNTDNLTAEQLEAIKKIKRLCRYPYDFRLPENVQFVGTLNMDETTKSLSPKVIDRSFIIEVGMANREDLYNSAEKLDYSFDDYMKLSVSDNEENTDTLVKDVMALYRNIIENIPESLKKEQVKISLSRRNEKNIEQLIRKNGSADYVFIGKILPSMKGMNITEDNFKTIYGAFDIPDNKINIKKITEKLHRMYDSELNEINFWR